MIMRLLLFTVFVSAMFSCASKASQPAEIIINNDIIQNMDTATFGAGCFWCVEAIFQQLEGVISVKPGYTGGTIKNPSYKEVCTGRTGHAEVAQIIYDPKIISFQTLVEVFFATHDPTTLNRQGADEGTQYRSAIFYHNEDQKEIAEKAVIAANESGEWDREIVTEVSPFTIFYEAEDYHHNYYLNNATQPYCSIVITPKMDKFKKRFSELIK